MIDYKKFVENSRKWLYDYIKDNRLKSLVIGISGGIDSTVTCAIVHPVCYDLGIPLIGRSLPAHTNNPDEINAATLVGQAFCDDFKEVPIERMFGIVVDELELNEGKMTLLQLGNIKARLRMIYLYNLASIHKGCVIDTDNRTEHELGFWTIHGDVGDLNCGLIHLWKTEVYGLADYLFMATPKSEPDKLKALEQSIILTPTDGNGVMSGGDCAQFDLDNYEQVDDVLQTMYFSKEKYFSPSAAKNEYFRLIDSYNEQGVDKVMTLHQSSEFKRKPQPIIPTKYVLFGN